MNHPPKRINILASKNGVGLQKDQEILTAVLTEAGHQVDQNDVHQKSLYYRLHAKKSYDINIFCQHLNPFWLNAAETNWLIPNQELFAPTSIPHLKEFSLILCKTQYAASLFKKLGCRAIFTSFSSKDRWDPGTGKKEEAFFHLSGKSPFKGTEAVLNAWRENPDFPLLTIVENAWKKREDPGLKNVRFIFEYQSEEQMTSIMNQNAFHLCPSQAEGFGHYIVEALSAKAVVLTTDAPPMNELVNSERGILCPYQTSTPYGIGKNFFVNPEELAKKVRQILNLTATEKKQLTENARSFYLQNDLFFRNQLLQFIHA